MNQKSVLAVLCLAAMTGSAFAKKFTSQEIPHVPNEALIKIKAGQKKNFLSKKSVMGIDIKQEMSLLSGDLVLVKALDRSAVSLVAQLKSLPEVEQAEPNFLYHAIKTEDQHYGVLWGLQNIGRNEPDRNGVANGKQGTAGADVGAEAAWAITKGSKKVVVAIIDTGIDYNHEDLKQNIWTNPNEIPNNGIDEDGNGYVDDYYGWNAITDSADPMDGNDHGTHCAGTIGASHDNGLGVAGVMADVSLMGVKFLSDDGGGTLADAVKAIDYATRMDVDIMSNSWGGGGFSQILEDSIVTAKDLGILFVAAAGNSNSNNDSRPSYPATYEVENVISVASHTFEDVLSSFSCYGKRTVHVAAPGSNIMSTTPRNTYKVFSGTSMATPHVSGVLGLLIAHEGRLPVEEVRERLMATTVPGASYRRTTASGGRVNAYNLLTNTRIPRGGPNEADWQLDSLPLPFETTHPYSNNNRLSKTYTFRGAKYIKLVIEKYETEANYDFIVFKDGHGAVIEKLSGRGNNFETDYAETDTISIEFSSDTSQTEWGVLIRDVKVIY